MKNYNVLICSDYPIVRTALCMLVKNNIPNSSFIFFNSIDTLFITQNEKRFDLLIVDTRSESDLDLIYSKSSFLKKEIKIVCLIENLNFNKNRYYKNFIYIDKVSEEDKVVNCLNNIFKKINTNNFKNVTNSIKGNNSLSKREIECAILLMKGYSTNQISKKLSLALTTVSTYKMRILKKTRTKNLVELTKSLYNLENLD